MPVFVVATLAVASHDCWDASDNPEKAKKCSGQDNVHQVKTYATSLFGNVFASHCPTGTLLNHPTMHPNVTGTLPQAPSRCPKTRGGHCQARSAIGSRHIKGEIAAKDYDLGLQTKDSFGDPWPVVPYPTPRLQTANFSLSLHIHSRMISQLGCDVVISKVAPCTHRYMVCTPPSPPRSAEKFRRRLGAMEPTGDHIAGGPVGGKPRPCGVFIRSVGNCWGA